MCEYPHVPHPVPNRYLPYLTRDFIVYLPAIRGELLHRSFPNKRGRMIAKAFHQLPALEGVNTGTCCHDLLWHERIRAAPDHLLKCRHCTCTPALSGNLDRHHPVFYNGVVQREEKPFLERVFPPVIKLLSAPRTDPLIIRTLAPAEQAEECCTHQSPQSQHRRGSPALTVRSCLIISSVVSAFTANQVFSSVADPPKIDRTYPPFSWQHFLMNSSHCTNTGE